MYKKVLKFIEEDYKFLTVYGFLIIMAYGFHMFNLTLYGDDWLAYQYSEFQYRWVVSIGRWLTRTVWMVFDDDYFVPVLSLVTLLLSFYVAIKLHFKALGINTKKLYYLFIIIFAFSPVFVEITSFKMAHFTLSIAIVFISIADYYLSNYLKLQKIFPLLIASVFLSLAVSLYQAVAIFSLQFMIMFIMLKLINNKNINNIKLEVLNIFKFLILGIFLYIIEVKLSLYFYDVSVSSNKSYSISLLLNSKNILHNFYLFQDYIVHFLFKEQHFYPQFLKYLVLVFLFTLLIFIYKDIKAKNSNIKIRIVFFFILLFTLICSPFLIGIINPTAFRYNALIPIASSYAIVITSLYYYINKSNNKLLKDLFFISVSLVVFIFIFQQNKAATIRHANFSRDVQIANRMLTRIESDKHYIVMKKRKKCDLIIIGRKLNSLTTKARPFYNYSQGVMGSSIINCNTFSCQMQHIRELFRLAGLDETIKFKFHYYRHISDIPKQFIKSRISAEKIEKWPASGFLIPIKTGFILNL